MHQSGSILLVSCYELGHQPLAIASPVAFLQRAGYSPSVLDLSVNTFDDEMVARADFIGLSVPMHTALRLGARAAERIRAIKPTAHICFYGLYASLNAEYLLTELADSVIGGEFEEPLLMLISAMQNGQQPRSSKLEITGVSFPDGLSTPYLQRLNFAQPDFHALPPLSNYAHLVHEGNRRPAGYVEASRGCLHRCLHCPITPIYDGRFFVVPETIVMGSIRELVRSGATHITFGDPDFLNGPGHSLRIIRAMHDEFPNLTFDFTAKVEHLLKHRALLQEFAEAGCLFVISAFESLSDVVLKNLNKGHTREDALRVLELFREVDLTLRPTWVPFTPWTTLADYIDLLECVHAQRLVEYVDPVQYTIRLLVPPGSALLRQPEMAASLGSLDQASFTYRWQHADARMDLLQARVSQVVEQMNQTNQNAFSIFQQVRELAYEATGEKPAELDFDQNQHFEPPRLTESWFCCSEPTGSQLDFVDDSKKVLEPAVPAFLTQIQRSQISHAKGPRNES